MEYSPELFWSIVLIFALCVAIVIVSGNFALKGVIINSEIVRKRRTPWGIDCAVILFLLYAILIPAVSLRITPYFVPDLHLDAFSSPQSNSESNEVLENSKEESNNERSVKQASPKQSVATQHPMARLLIRSYESSRFNVVLFVFFLTVVCVAPLTEEFIFRVVMQGACENSILPNSPQKVSKDDSYFPRVPKWKIALVIGVPALIFATLHTGTVEDSNAPLSNDLLFQTTVSSLVSNIVTIVVGFSLLRLSFKANSQDLGFDKISFTSWRELYVILCKFIKEFYRGIVLYLIAAPIVLGINLLAQKAFPNVIVAPIPIFLFAIWVGYVYYKTRQYVVCLGMHIALNFTSFILLLLNVRAHTFGYV